MPLDVDSLLDSWIVHLRAEHKSASTIISYRRGVEQFVDWCGRNDRPVVLDRASVSGFTASILASGGEPTTAKIRQLAVRRFSGWLADESEIASDQLYGMKPPKLDQKIVEPLTDDDIRAMLKACGNDMFGRRDEAIIRLMVEAGVRAGEVAAMSLTDVNLLAGTAVIRRGKGARGRVVPFGPQTVRALDRYIRARKLHKLASSDALWLGDHGLSFGYSALWKSLSRRAQTAGVVGFHPHKLRHTAAHRWLAAGGSESGLMAVAGWSNPMMLQRYSRARASERAADEARKLNLGDL